MLPVRKTIPMDCGPFVNKAFEFVANFPDLYEGREIILFAIDQAKTRLDHAYNEGRIIGLYLRSWHGLYSTVEIFGRLVKYCSFGEAETCENKEYNVFGILHRLSTWNQGQNGWFVKLSIRSPRGKEAVNYFQLTGSWSDGGFLCLQEEVSFIK